MLRFFLIFCVLFFSFPSYGMDKDSVPWRSPEELVSLIQKNKNRKIVFIYTSWCPYCREVIPKMIDLAKIKPNGVIAISTDHDTDKFIVYINEMGDVPFLPILSYEKKDGDFDAALGSIGIYQENEGIPYFAVMDEKNDVLTQGTLVNLKLEEMIRYVLTE